MRTVIELSNFYADHSGTGAHSEASKSIAVIKAALSAPPIRVTEDDIDTALKGAVSSLIQNCSVICEDAGLCSMEVKNRIIVLLRSKGALVVDGEGK